jgi:cobalt-zinc-cadmium efflux system outer membrane protein
MSCGLLILLGVMSMGSPPARGQEKALTLDQALEVARQRAPIVLAARARIEEARGRYQGAAARFRANPVFETEAGPRTRGGARSADIDVAFSQDFELGGRRTARVAGAQAGIDRETAFSNDVLRRLLRDVAIAFYHGLTAQERVRLLTMTDQVATEFLRTAQRRFEAGEIPILEVNLARTSAARVRAELKAASADFVFALGEFRVLLGMRPDEPVTIRGDLRARRSYDLEQLFAQAKDRPDIRVLEAEIREAEADIRLGQGFRRPDIGFTTRYQREEGANIVQGGLKITLPVFSNGQELRAVGTARASRVRGELEALLRAVYVETKTALDVYLGKVGAVEELEKNALPSLDENEALARRSYEEGELGLVELLLIRRETLEIRLAYADRLEDAAIAGVEVEFRSGVLR